MSIGITIKFLRNWTSADDFQEWFANHLMLHRTETFFVVNDKEKRGH
ncbi:MAG: hypothetical protein H0X63_07310 [Flavobacteriales bacterium]|nr:hypothetical protein [Flavobacteriales bacterium]